MTSPIHLPPRIFICSSQWSSIHTEERIFVIGTFGIPDFTYSNTGTTTYHLAKQSKSRSVTSRTMFPSRRRNQEKNYSFGSESQRDPRSGEAKTDHRVQPDRSVRDPGGSRIWVEGGRGRNEIREERWINQISPEVAHGTVRRECVEPHNRAKLLSVRNVA